MARTHSDLQDTQTIDPNVAVSVDDLRGCAVWTEHGDRVGTLRGFRTEDGKITALEVQHGWFRGHTHIVDARSMRMEHGDVVVPASAAPDLEEQRSLRARSRSRALMGTPAASGTLVAGRSGARARFGGFDAAAGFLGALVAIASFLLLGGLLGAVFGTNPGVALDLGLYTWEELATAGIAVAAVTLAIACFVGGVAAGRIARFDGVRNGLSITLWAVLITVVYAALGTWVGDEYDVLSTVDVPSVASDDIAVAGSIAVAAMLAIMLVFGALGGLVGSLWHRRVDRAMLTAVPIGARTSDAVITDDASSGDAVRTRGVGSRVASDSADDVRRLR